MPRGAGLLLDALTPLLLCLGGCDYFFHLEHVDGPGEAGAVDSLIECPADYTTQLFSSMSHYRLVDTATSWDIAVGDCADDAPGATHLVVISTDAERMQLHAQSPASNRWIGLTDRNSENMYTWITAESAPTPAAGVTPWGPGQPDDQMSDQDCVRIENTTSFYDDGQCASNFRYACECDGFADDPSRY